MNDKIKDLAEKSGLYIAYDNRGVTDKEIENPLTRNVRYLDKLVDELAKGRKMEKILRS